MPNQTIKGFVAVCLTLTFGVLCGCNTAVPLSQRKQVFRERMGQYSLVTDNPNLTVAVLQFDTDGHLVNHFELAQLASALKLENANPETCVRNVLIASFGWGHDFTSSQDSYRKFAAQVINARRDKGGDLAKKWLVIFVSWPSGRGLASKTFKTLSPSRRAAEIIGLPVDVGLMPMSVWSSAQHANTVGAGELSDAIQWLHEEAFSGVSFADHPVDYYLLGHSFGTRVVSGVMGLRPAERLQTVGNFLSNGYFNTWSNINHTNYTFRTQIRGGVYVLPAMSVAEIDAIDRPIFVLQSRHDHLNNSVFPLANIPYNFSSGLVMPAIQEHYRNQTGTNQASSSDRTFDAEPLGEVTRGPKEVSRRISDPVGSVKELYREIMFTASVPLFSASAMALSPLSALKYEYQHHTTNLWFTYPLDTLFQIPVAEILSEQVPRAPGSESKGMFNTGRYLQSGANLRGATNAYVRLEELMANFRHGAKLVVPNGPVYVDCSQTISKSALFKVDYNKKWMDYTLGWFDPVGSHTQFEEDEIFELLLYIMSDRFQPDGDQVVRE